MIAPITLLAVAALEEVAYLSLVDTLCYTEVGLAVCEKAVLVVASAGQEHPAELGLL